MLSHDIGKLWISCKDVICAFSNGAAVCIMPCAFFSELLEKSAVPHGDKITIADDDMIH